MNTESKSWAIHVQEKDGRELKTVASSLGLQTEDDVRKYVSAAHPGGKLVSVRDLSAPADATPDVEPI